jgi:hypothetical protein
MFGVNMKAREEKSNITPLLISMPHGVLTILKWTK